MALNPFNFQRGGIQSEPPARDVRDDDGLDSAQNLDENDSQLDDDDDESIDPSEMLAGFFSDADGADNDSIKPNTKKPAIESDDASDAVDPDIAALQSSVHESIRNLRLPDDFNFDDFQSGDPRELRKAYQSLQQHAVVSAIQTIIPVMQRAFQQFDTTVNERITKNTQQFTQQTSNERILQREIPAYENPQFQGMVKHLDKQLRDRGVDDPVGRAKQINKLLAKLGVKGQSGNGASGRTETSSTRKGGDALDGFFPNPPVRRR